MAYVAAVILFWTPATSVWLQRFSIPMWILGIVHVAAIAGPLRVPLFIALIVLWFVGRMKFFGDEKVHRVSVGEWFATEVDY